MCGIAGVMWSAARPSNPAATIDAMLATIEHRGPDSQGRFGTSFAHVGFRRLSIIDLAGGDQPLSNETGSIHCFLNGEIYNYQELRRDLEMSGHHFRTNSDAEVLPHLYEEYGTSMFSHLNGMFVICLIDVPNHQVLLARDPFGVKQLYYAVTSQGIAFASELKAILASDLVTPEVDESSLLAYLNLFYCPEPYTLVRGVRKLLPGTWMMLKTGDQPVMRTYYELSTTPSYGQLSLEEAAATTRELLWESVKLQLHADVPVGISLSGGIDSSAIACAAISYQNQGTDPLALTIHWPDTIPEELASAKELCQHLELRHHVLEIPVRNLLNELPLLGWMSDEPVADPAIYSQFCVAREAANHVKVLLSGAGGDELFGGYGSYSLPKRYAAFNKLPRLAQKPLAAVLNGKWMPAQALTAVMSYPESRFGWHSYCQSNLSEAQQSALAEHIAGSRDASGNLRSRFEKYRHYDAANQQMIVDFLTYLPDQILTMMDRATMAASIEGRVPFLDPALVSFAFSLPGAMKQGRPIDSKRVLKMAIAKEASSSVLERKKAGMPSPFASFLTRHLDDVRKIILSPQSYVGSVLPRQWLREMMATPQRARQDFRLLYALTTLEIWHKLFIRDRNYTRPDMTAAELFELPGAQLAL